MTFASENGWSALSFRGRVICYCLTGDRIDARELGTSTPLEITPELRVAIDSERLRQAQKVREP